MNSHSLQHLTTVGVGVKLWLCVEVSSEPADDLFTQPIPGGGRRAVKEVKRQVREKRVKQEREREGEGMGGIVFTWMHMRQEREAFTVCTITQTLTATYSPNSWCILCSINCVNYAYMWMPFPLSLSRSFSFRRKIHTYWKGMGPTM